MPLTPGSPRIHYLVQHGSSAEVPVLFIQGLGLSSRFWFDVPAMVRAETGRTTVVVDNRGTGQSDRVRRPFRIGDMADDVAAVLDEAGIPQAIVVGISLGGMIAQEVALRHPHRVAGLVLMATTPGLPLGRLPTLSALGTLLTMPFNSRGANERMAGLLLPAKDVSRAATILAHWPPALALDPPTPATFFGQFVAASLHSTGRRLGRIQCPTVIVAGAEDRLIPADNSRRMAAKIRHSVLMVLPEVAHAITASEPRVVLRALAELATGEATPAAARYSTTPAG